MYQESNHQKDTSQEKIQSRPTSKLDSLVRQGAQKMLQYAIETEVENFIQNYKDQIDENGYRLVVKNGHYDSRDILTSIGKIPIQQPRVDDRKLRQTTGVEGFSSAILPKYIRRSPSLDNLIPMLYLKGISTKDFPTALAPILGDQALNLSSATVGRLKEQWLKEYETWNKRDLSGKQYIYIWVDGIYFNIRLQDATSCILVVMGADSYGNKELLAICDGERESKLSWKAVLLDLKQRGLQEPSLAIGDGALGFWAALPEVFEHTAEQRCWVHKTVNILDKLPKKLQGKAKGMIHEMYMSPNKKAALKAYEQFIAVFEDRYPDAVKCLTKDIERIFIFYDFPAAHWVHIRTTNPIESTFATVRLRTKRTKGCGSRNATLTMVFKLTKEAEKTWKKLRAFKLLPFVFAGEKFIDGEPVNISLKSAA
jgi:putative transposase